MTKYSFDAVIIGGGIAGLWTLNRLCNRGYNAILLEHSALGSGQTIASQGMIHGGIKYTLNGALTGASEAIADMPDHWRACFRGEGDVDLSESKVLSDHFYLWSTASLTSRFGGFIASKATRGRVDKVSRRDLPPLFNHKNFRGSLYKLVDMVVDTTSVLKALAANYDDRIFKIDWAASRWQQESSGQYALDIESAGENFRISASAFICCAGKGNEDLLNAVDATAPQMQLRPLRQVMVKHNVKDLFFGHCVTTDKTPRLTISSHPLQDGQQVWYLGGTLAEKGVAQSPQQLIDTAKEELGALMPWIDFSNAEWATLAVDRAEPRQQKMMRPDNAFAQWAEGPANIMAAWPTKLTLSPHLSEEIERLLRIRNISPGDTTFASLPLPKPEIATTPWHEAFSRAK